MLKYNDSRLWFRVKQDNINFVSISDEDDQFNWKFEWEGKDEDNPGQNQEDHLKLSEIFQVQ